MTTFFHGGRVISIHALREEGDSIIFVVAFAPSNFYPRPPRGGRPLPAAHALCCSPISIHALREEGDSQRFQTALQR